MIKRVILFSIIMVMIFVSISLPSISAKNQPEKLESVFYQLTYVQNPDEFAKMRGLYIEDGKVRVVIELHNASDTIPDGYDVLLETRYENLVQALVPIENLINLSNEHNITFIRAPLHAYPQETSETQIPLTLIWICIGIIVIIIAVTAVIYLKRGLKDEK